jgi:hypothetical protein
MFKLLFYTFIFILIVNSAEAEQSLIRLDLAVNDIENIKTEDNCIFIKLKSNATSKLKNITNRHIGKKLQVFLDDIKVIEAVIRASVDSGRIAVQNPSNELIEKVKTIQEESKNSGEG